ncbi:uncharacterized protein ARMOST_18115 [Armillaria ostoyae]|uniref:Nephrocystin 3-like N-terminal domain-containing protein n=1 Tax=Armillaria ostoyae TaxID=47428 RepID=A0A284S0V1_ARMOS|nr:uncharacterized protein ARMOST_18115 [Armillaria ostoyae]
MSAVASTKETMANEGSRILYIREAELITIASTEESKLFLKITAGKEKQETEEFKFDGGGAMPKWTINMNLGDLDPQTVISWKLYRLRMLLPKEVLGSVEKTLGELFEGSSTSADVHLSDGTSEIAVLKISGSNSASTVMNELVPSIKKPSENHKFLDSSETLRSVFEAAKGMIDTLAGVHPVATIAWGFLSVGFEVLKNQRDTNQAVLDLYAEMISVYEEASKNDILQRRDGLHGTYSSLFKQTIECAMFIEGYAKKSGIRCLFMIDISGQAEKFHQAFTDLKDQLTRGFTQESFIVTLGVQQLVSGVQELVFGVHEHVELQAMRDQLTQHLKPPQELDPKSKCTQGTCIKTINTIMSWIAQCNSGTMWCKGLAGTGKSSLMGTLHDLLIEDIGGRSRLAAFVCYDRIEYSKASKSITSIAYALGMFDKQIGMAISEAIQTRWPVDPSAQFQCLLCGPLESISGLLDGGPLVVIVDGLDESDVSDDMLAVLAEGFGPKLPFMRLIVSSRPVHRIATAFKQQDCIYTLYLDTSSESVNRDIHFYLGLQLDVDNRDPVFQAKCKQLNAVDELAAHASGLFIWAATIAKFICGWPGISRLEAVLATDVSSDATEALTILYHTTLNILVSEIPGANADVKICMRNVLGAVLVAKMSDDESSILNLELPGITEDILDNIVLVDKGNPPSHHIISMLGSILTPESEDEPIQLIHKSLADFLQDQNRCGDEWYVDVTLHYRALAKQCLDVSKSFLQKWSSDIDKDIGTIPVHISQYALLGVLWHVKAFDDSGLELASFFRHYFLLWLDVLLCIKCSNILSSLLMVLNWSNQFGNTESRTLFYHAYLFAYRASQDGGHFSSGLSYAMSLSPSSNIIRKAWEQSNKSDSPISSGKERLLCYMTL